MHILKIDQPCQTNSMMNHPLWQGIKHFTCPISTTCADIMACISIHVSGQVTPCVRCGIHVSVHISGCQDLPRVPLLPYPTPFRQPLIHILLYAARSYFAQYTLMPRETVLMRGFFILYILSFIKQSHVPYAGKTDRHSLCSTKHTCILMLR